MTNKIPYYVEVFDLINFARLVCALERVPYPILSFSFNKKKILGITLDSFNETPIVYYTYFEKPNDNHYLGYKINHSVEEIKIVEGIDNPSFIYSPIINIEKVPLYFSKKKNPSKRSKFISFKVKDLSDLARVSAYKTVFDEPPLPLFLFRNPANSETTFILGTLANLHESETNPYFIYTLLQEEPAKPFLRYSSQNSESLRFSANLNEHGYTYMKIIKLSGNHLLIDL